MRAVRLLRTMNGIAEDRRRGRCKGGRTAARKGDENSRGPPGPPRLARVDRVQEVGRARHQAHGPGPACKRRKCSTRFSADPAARRPAWSARTDDLFYMETSDHTGRKSASIFPSTATNCAPASLALFRVRHDAVSRHFEHAERRRPGATIRKSLKRYFCRIMDHRSRLVPALREFRAKWSSNLEDLFRDAKELPAAS